MFVCCLVFLWKKIRGGIGSYYFDPCFSCILRILLLDAILLHMIFTIS